MPQLAELQPNPVLPAEFSFQVSEAERTVINILPFVEGGAVEWACEQVGRAKGLQPFSPDEFPASAEATYIPYQGNPGADSCEFQIASFLLPNVDPQSQAEAIVSNIGKVFVEPSAPNVIRFNAPDGGVHQVVSQKPSVMLNWLASKGYNSEANEQTFTFRLDEAELVVEKPVVRATTGTTDMQTQILPLPKVRTDVFEFRQRPRMPKRPTAKFQPQGHLGNQIVELPVGGSGQEGSLVISEATIPEVTPVPKHEKPEAKQDAEAALPPSEQYLTIRRVMGMVGTHNLINRHGLEAGMVERAMTEVMDNRRLDEAIPDTHVSGNKISVTGFDEATSQVIRAALKEVINTAPDMGKIQYMLRLSPAADVPDISPHLNMADLVYHTDTAKQAELVLEQPALMPRETFSQKAVRVGRRGLSALRNIFRQK